MKNMKNILEAHGIEVIIDDNCLLVNSEDEGIINMTDWDLEQIKEWLGY